MIYHDLYLQRGGMPMRTGIPLSVKHYAAGEAGRRKISGRISGGEGFMKNGLESSNIGRGCYEYADY